MSSELCGRTFLVVDDDEGIRTALVELLSCAGASVVSASDGAAAAQGLEQHASAVDLVLLDLTLPDQSPQAVVERLRSLVPGIPILISSGCDQADGPGLCRRLEAAGFLAKPYRFQQLVRAVSSALGPSTS